MSNLFTCFRACSNKNCARPASQNRGEMNVHDCKHIFRHPNKSSGLVRCNISASSHIQPEGSLTSAAALVSAAVLPTGMKRVTPCSTCRQQQSKAIYLARLMPLQRLKNLFQIGLSLKNSHQATYAAKVPTTRADTMGVKVRASSPHTSTSSIAVGKNVNTTALNTMETLRVPITKPPLAQSVQTD